MKDNILVVYFTRTGRSEKVALELNKHYKCMVEKINEKEKRKGISGYIKSAWQGIKKSTCTINKVKYNPQNYNITIIITPLWAGNISSPVRTYLQKYSDKINDYGIIITHNSSSYKAAEDEIKAMLHKEPIFQVEYKKKDIDNNSINVLDILKFSH